MIHRETPFGRVSRTVLPREGTAIRMVGAESSPRCAPLLDSRRKWKGVKLRLT